jgi:hypothetical protein
VSDELNAAQRRVIEAAIAYAMGTNPDDHPFDVELRAAVRELARVQEEDA